MGNTVWIPLLFGKSTKVLGSDILNIHYVFSMLCICKLSLDLRVPIFVVYSQ